MLWNQLEVSRQEAMAGKVKEAGQVIKKFKSKVKIYNYVNKLCLDLLLLA